MAYIPWWNRTGPITLGERFGLNQISTRAKPLSPTKSYVEKPYNWEEGDWWDLDDQSVGNTKILEDFEITEEMRRRPNAAGGRIDLKPGGLVEPGVTHYATSPEKTGKFKYPVTNQHGTVWRDKPFIHKPLSTTQQKLADTIKKEIGRSLTPQELTRIRQNQVTKVSEFRSFIPADIWKETTDKIKKLRLEKVNINLSDEAFAKKLNDVYKIKTRSRKLWSNVTVGELQKSLKMSDKVGANRIRSLDEIKKIVRSLKKGEQILKDFDAGKISETQLRSKASHKVYQTKPETKIRLEKWMKENPEIVRAMEEKKQMRGWSRSSFPRMGKNAKSNIWANLHENVRKERGRIELIDDNVIYEKDGTINWKRAGKNGKPNWQNVKFKDKVKNAIFTWDNLEKKVDNVFGKNAYKRFAFPYEARNQLTEATITYKGNERSVGSVLNEALLKKHYKKYAKPGETFDAFKARKAKGFGAFEANHMYANDPWQTQLTFRDSNRVLSNLDDTFQKELRMAVDDPKKTKQLTKNFINKVKALPGGIEWNIGDQMIGKKPSIGSVTQAAFGETGLSRTFEANPQLKNLLKTVKTAKGPPRLKAIQLLLAAGVSMKLLNDYGISSAEAAEAQTLEPSDKTQEASVLSAVGDNPIKSAAAVAGADIALNKAKLSKAILKGGEKVLAPLVTPGATTAIHLLDGEFDVTNPANYLAPMFWKQLVERYGAKRALRELANVPGFKNKALVMRDVLIRSGLPVGMVNVLSRASFPLAAATGVGYVAKESQPNIFRDDKGDLRMKDDQITTLPSNMIKDYHWRFASDDFFKKEYGITKDKYKSNLPEFLDLEKQKAKKPAPFDSYFMGGIASLIK